MGKWVSRVFVGIAFGAFVLALLLVDRFLDPENFIDVEGPNGIRNSVILILVGAGFLVGLKLFERSRRPRAMTSREREAYLEVFPEARDPLSEEVWDFDPSSQMTDSMPWQLSIRYWKTKRLISSSFQPARDYGIVSFGFSDERQIFGGLYIRWEPSARPLFKGYVSSDLDIRRAFRFSLATFLIGLAVSHWFVGRQFTPDDWSLALLLDGMFATFAAVLVLLVFTEREDDESNENKLVNYFRRRRTPAQRAAARAHRDLALVLGLTVAYGTIVEGEFVSFFPFNRVLSREEVMSELGRIDQLLKKTSDRSLT